jgi:hypothetical protein
MARRERLSRRRCDQQSHLQRLGLDKTTRRFAAFHRRRRDSSVLFPSRATDVCALVFRNSPSRRWRENTGSLHDHTIIAFRDYFPPHSALAISRSPLSLLVLDAADWEKFLTQHIASGIQLHTAYRIAALVSLQFGP